MLLSLRVERVETLKYVVSVGPRSEKFNIVGNNMDARKNAIFVIQLLKSILQTITQIIQ